MMPMGQYNIGKYVNYLLAKVGFVGDKGLDDQSVSEVILRTIGGNPRSIKRLVNSISLIQIFTEENLASNSNNSSTENNEGVELDPEIEKFLIFALLCLQIAYPPIYSLLTRNPDFTKWDNDLALGETKQKEEENKELFDKEFDLIKQSEEFDDEWEQALFRICYLRPRLKPRVEDISKFFGYLLTETEGEKAPIGDAISHVLNQTSVTSVTSTDQGQEQPKKKFTVEGLSIKETLNFELKNRNKIFKYTLNQYEGGAVRVFDEDGNAQVARGLLRQLASREQLASKVRAGIKNLGTRQLGSEIIKYFKNKNGE